MFCTIYLKYDFWNGKWNKLILSIYILIYVPFTKQKIKVPTNKIKIAVMFACQILDNVTLNLNSFKFMISNTKTG